MIVEAKEEIKNDRKRKGQQYHMVNDAILLTFKILNSI